MVGGTPATTSPRLEVRALVLGHGVHGVEFSVDEGEPMPMRSIPQRAGLWVGELSPIARARGHRIRVHAFDREGGYSSDEIFFYPAWVQLRSTTNGFGLHRHSVGAWAEHGLLGTRLGPNANGKRW
jgi:Icc protein